MSMQCFIHVKVKFEKRKTVLPIEKFRFLTLAKNTIMSRHLLSVFRSIICQVVAYERKGKGKFQTFSLKWSREVVAYKRFQIL